MHVEVRDPRENDQRLSAQLCEIYGLNSVHIVSPLGLGPTDLRRALGRRAWAVLAEVLTPGDSLGVVWSETVHEMADACEQTSLSDISVVQLRGSFGDDLNAHRMRQAHEKLAVALNAECYITDVPAVFSTLEERYLPEHRSAVAQLLARSQECRVVVFSPGTCTQTSRLFRSQLLSAVEKELLAQRAVGASVRTMLMQTRVFACRMRIVGWQDCLCLICVRWSKRYWSPVGTRKLRSYTLP